MKTLQVDLGERSYPILIGSGLMQDADLLNAHIPGKKVLIVSNETVAPLHAQALLNALSDREVELISLPDGEKFKNLETLNLIFTRLLELDFDRNCTLVALGGGVVGDICGFAAASYQRGVKFVQVPTTLLAQVDSSVGGKTGINHPLGKNMIGAFYQPQSVIVDIDTLSTLPERELKAGVGEVIKYGLGLDVQFLQWLEANAEALLAREPDALAHAVEQSCAIKARVVAADERESGQRALLNLGHTYGHAIETHTGYSSWLHGEAVGAGMVMAADLSLAEGLIDQATAQRSRQLIERCGLPTSPPADMDSERFLALMARDKKTLDNNLRLVLMTAPGESVCTSNFSHKNLVQLIDNY
ncbi:MAG: 3-dehydroquinate synthase [Granulosicoccaceae bacterium]